MSTSSRDELLISTILQRNCGIERSWLAEFSTSRSHRHQSQRQLKSAILQEVAVVDGAFRLSTAYRDRGSVGKPLISWVGKRGRLNGENLVGDSASVGRSDLSDSTHGMKHIRLRVH